MDWLLFGSIFAIFNVIPGLVVFAIPGGALGYVFGRRYRGPHPKAALFTICLPIGLVLGFAVQTALVWLTSSASIRMEDFEVGKLVAAIPAVFTICFLYCSLPLYLWALAGLLVGRRRGGSSVTGDAYDHGGEGESVSGRQSSSSSTVSG